VRFSYKMAQSTLATITSLRRRPASMTGVNELGSDVYFKKPTPERENPQRLKLPSGREGTISFKRYVLAFVGTRKKNTVPLGGVTRNKTRTVS